MAPNLAVKSDSWIDLSINAPVPIKNEPRELARFTGSPTNHRHSISSFYPTAMNDCNLSTLNSDTGNESSSSSRRNKANSNHKHSYLQSRYFNELEKINSSSSNSNNNKQRVENKNPLKSSGRIHQSVSGGGCNQIINQCSKDTNSSEHLLIRMRQQCYLNRSTSTTLSSNLSNSVDLMIGPPSKKAPATTDTTAHSGCELDDDAGANTNDGDDNDDRLWNGDGARLRQQQQVASVHLGSQGSLRLRERRQITYMKERLKQGGRVGGPVAGGGRQASSPLVRSLSSFGERLSGKLTHFRHSCKSFLYNYNHQSAAGHETAAKGQPPENQQPASCCNLKQQRPVSCAGPFSQIGFDTRRRMTGDWIERHCGGAQPEVGASDDNTRRYPRPPERPHSLEVSSLLAKQQENKLRLANHNTRRPEQRVSTFLVKHETERSKSHLRDSNILTNDTKGLRLATNPSPLLLSSSSSTTLVSKPSLESISSASTINSSSVHMSRPAINQTQQQQQTVSNFKRVSPPKVALEASKVDEEKRAAAAACFAGPLAPTSDYWSTVNSGSDYYKQLLEQQQQVSGSPMQLNGQLMLHQPTPILISDQEYYLDVANAAAAAAATHSAALIPGLHLAPAQHDLKSNQLPLQNEQTQFAFVHPSANKQIHLNHQLNHLQQLQHLDRMQPPVSMGGQQNLDCLDEDYDDYAVPSDESCRLDRSQVELVQMIGEGQKGYVFLGKLQSKDGKHIQDVAIKTLKYETNQLIEKLMREAAMMQQFEHPHIIKFIGVCPETPALIAMELAEFGEVKQYLKLNKHLICVSQLVLFTFQISTALSYLESKQFVHRDVAARNVLVCSHNCVKLADFGLSRDLQLQQQATSQSQLPNDLQFMNNNDSPASWRAFDTKAALLQATQLLVDPNDKSHYVAASRGKLPVRWLAPESLAFRRFTSASDVWMFAVCSWEFFQYGQVRPWAQIRNNQVLQAIESGQRLARPPNCPARLYQLMLQCWSYAPIQRPKFRDLKQILWSIYLNERTKQQLELEQQQQLQQQQHLQLQQQQLQLQLQLQKQQIRPQRVIGAHEPAEQEQDAQQRLAAMFLRDRKHNLAALSSGNLQWTNHGPPSKASGAPAGGSNSATKRHSNLLEASNSQKHLERPCASPMMTNYSSNLSGYSSNTATTATEHSVNSSRSSSMGSLARQQAAASMAWPGRSRQQEMDTPNGTEIGDSRANGKLVAPADAEQQSKIDQNIRRFQRAQGHLLQKQRSQGSIATGQIGGMWANHHGQMYQYGFDDHALDRRHRRPISELQLTTHPDNGPSEPVDGNDADDDDDSSDLETTRLPAYRSPLGVNQMTTRQQQQLSSNWSHVQPTSKFTESTYDGIASPGEVAMLRGTSNPLGLCRKHSPAGSPIAVAPVAGAANGCKPADHKISSREEQPRDQSASARSENKAAGEAKRAHEQKLANIIEALKVAPMKAKLTYRADAEAMRNQKDQPVGDRAPGCCAGTAAAESAAQDDEQQQLALHRRLLGHIRPAAGGGKGSRRRQSAKVEPASCPVAHQSSKETVDQSLQILESLISEKPRFATVHDQQVKAAQTSVAQIAEFQRLRRNHHQRPKSVSVKSATFSTRSP